MGGRYLVTGVQLALMETNCDNKELIDIIFKDQFVFDSEKDISTDIKNVFKEKYKG